MKKITILLAGAAGYVLGARAGRQRYDQIASGARSVMQNPKVQSAKQQATDVVSHQAAVVGEKAKDAVSSAAATATDKVRGNGGSHSASEDWPASAPPPGS